MVCTIHSSISVLTRAYLKRLVKCGNTEKECAHRNAFLAKIICHISFHFILMLFVSVHNTAVLNCSLSQFFHHFAAVVYVLINWSGKNYTLLGKEKPLPTWSNGHS